MTPFKSSVWKYFVKEKDGTTKYNLYFKKLKTSGSTSNISQHIHRIHPEVLNLRGHLPEKMSTARFETRVAKEMQMITQQSPHGIACWRVGERNNRLQACVTGGQDTPYENGDFKLDILIPERYPFQPPNVTFVTPIYHPNVDTSGRICLDILKLPPVGTWRPALNIISVLTCVQQLMNEPNPDDPLMPEIAKEFKFNRTLFLKNAKEWTLKHAVSADAI